jgi:hypothetical protein
MTIAVDILISIVFGRVAASFFSWARSVLGIPTIHGILVPVVDFMFKSCDPGLLRTSSIVLASAYPQLDVIFAGGAIRQRSKPSLASSFQHAPVIPPAEANGAQATYDIGDDVEGIKGTIIRKQGLHDLGSHAQQERTDQ